MKPLTNAQSVRRNDLDWIRVIAVLLLVPFHSALIFNHGPYAVMYIKDAADSHVLDCVAGWIHQFHMPILFFVAGASSYFALGKRSNGQYLKERFFKLLLPAIFGIVLLIPPMTYITAIWQGYEENFWTHFIGFWQLNPADLNGMSGCFTPAHLWFLFFLFVFSFVALPLFLLFRKNGMQRFLQSTIDKVGSISVLTFLMVLSILAAYTNILGSINPVYYFLMFVAGYLFMIDVRVQSVIDKYASYVLFLSIIFEIMRQFFLGDIYNLTHSDNVIFVIEQLNRWLWMFTILGFGHRFLTQSNSVLKYLSASSFPFYIFHLLVNTIVGYFIIKLPLSIGVKYLLIVVFTISFTFLVYEIVRRIPYVRFVFGIKRKIKENK